MYRMIYILNMDTRIAVITPYGLSDEYRIGQVVRQGSALGAVLSSNSLASVTKDARNGMATTILGEIKMLPLCFVDDIAATGNSPTEVTRNH